MPSLRVLHLLAAALGTLALQADARAQGPSGRGARTAYYQQKQQAYEARTVPTGPVSKPFSGYYQPAGVSPYLALDAREGDSGLPNYHLFVKPQLEQQRYNAIQQAQYQRLQGQVRAAATNGQANPPAAATADHRDRFMNYGGYYPTRR